MSCFTGKRFGNQMVVGYFGGLLMCSNLIPEKEVESNYWEWMISVSLKIFQMCSMHISGDGKDNKRKSYQDCRGSEQFDSLCRIIYLRYLDGDRTPEMVLDAHGIKENVELVEPIELQRC